MESLRIHYIQHVPFEGPGYIETWAKQRNHTITSTKFYEQVILPETDDFDLLIIMGGPFGVYDEVTYPWLKKEKQFIKSAIDSNKIVIGICLGSQLIAEALGAKVYPNKKKEIGWYPVTLTEMGENEELLKDFPESLTVMHWHGDTFDLPRNSIHLMRTDICRNQAFLFRNRVLGLQFHLETSPESLKAIVENCRNELISDDYIQTENEILSDDFRCDWMNKNLVVILDRLLFCAMAG